MHIMPEPAELTPPGDTWRALTSWLEGFSFAFLPLAISIVACIAAVVIAFVVVNPIVRMSPFDKGRPVWVRWAWWGLVGASLLGPVLLLGLIFGLWGYLVAIIIVFVGVLVSLIVWLSSDRRSRATERRQNAAKPGEQRRNRRR